MAMGALKRISTVPMMLNSTSIKSFVMRLMASPLRASEYHAMGNFSTFTYIAFPQIPADPRSDRREREQRRVPHSILQNGDQHDAQTDVQQGRFRSNGLHKGIELSAQSFDSAGVRWQLNRRISSIATK